ncbi:MAG: hypothetical protein ACODAD_13745 [Planctomycetota bacterium]
MDCEIQNSREIEQLNQRGGRTLSIVDLIEADTIDVRMAAHAMRAVAQGASLLTGARPGGAGKTTLMAAILGLLPPKVPIITVDRSHVVRQGRERPANEPACYLVHEIGSGHWYGYLWGPDVADFISLIGGERRIASCLHADTLQELTDILVFPPLGVDRAALGRVGLILFIHVVTGQRRPQRRVASFWEADGDGEHDLVFQWNAKSDGFDQVGKLRDPEGLEPYERFIETLVDDGEADMEVVRRKVVGFYQCGS